ncbi:MAG: hypothetical protein AAB408_04260 [Patescibacteria group bacterium]
MNVMKKIALFTAMGASLLPAIVAAQYDANDTFGIGAARPVALGTRDVPQTVASVINVGLGLLGVIALVIILVGGFEWMTAGGNEEKTAEARKRIFAGIIGLAIILSSYAIARFVFQQLANATGANAVVPSATENTTVVPPAAGTT